MKTKLRKEFEAFQKETSKQIYLLQNPERFKFGDKVSLFYHDGKKSCDGVYKGRDKLNEDYYRYSWDITGRWTFQFECFVEVDDNIISWGEYSIRKFKEDANKTTD